MSFRITLSEAHNLLRVMWHHLSWNWTECSFTVVTQLLCQPTNFTASPMLMLPFTLGMCAICHTQKITSLITDMIMPIRSVGNQIKFLVFLFLACTGHDQACKLLLENSSKLTITFKRWWLSQDRDNNTDYILCN